MLKGPEPYTALRMPNANALACVQPFSFISINILWQRGRGVSSVPWKTLVFWHNVVEVYVQKTFIIAH